MIGSEQQGFHNTPSSMKVKTHLNALTHTVHTLVPSSSWVTSRVQPVPPPSLPSPSLYLHPSVPPPVPPLGSGLVRAISRGWFLSRGRGHGKGLVIPAVAPTVSALLFSISSLFFDLFLSLLSLSFYFSLSSFFSVFLSHPTLRNGDKGTKLFSLVSFFLSFYLSHPSHPLEGKAESTSDAVPLDLLRRGPNRKQPP